MSVFILRNHGFCALYITDGFSSTVRFFFLSKNDDDDSRTRFFFIFRSVCVNVLEFLLHILYSLIWYFTFWHTHIQWVKRMSLRVAKSFFSRNATTTILEWDFFLFRSVVNVLEFLLHILCTLIWNFTFWDTYTHTHTHTFNEFESKHISKSFFFLENTPHQNNQQHFLQNRLQNEG